MEFKLSNAIRVAVGSLSVAAAILCTSIAVNEPWVVHHDELVGINYTGNGFGFLPELPHSITAESTRRSILPTMIGHSLIEGNPKNIDQICLQRVSSVNDEVFSDSLKILSTMYGFGASGDPDRQVNDFMRRIDFLTLKSFRESAFKGGRHASEQRSLLTLLSRTDLNNSTLSNSEYKKLLDSCVM
ncbi:hypothetical protein AB4510_03255 [Vibrio sp. 10N.222.54.B12]|uniref:hypothetical protein n=1 Tax=unclassified Vibrio TaxID=2614977 RepID=UPI00354DC5E0